ncbi:MAG: ATP/GTP-binding protein [Promethearchaeota archaeon]
MIIDKLARSLQLKVVYFGPAMSGKTTSMKALFNHFGRKDDVYSIESTVNRTLFFDYGTFSFQNNQWMLKVHVYSTTGQDFYLITRPITLKAIDGLIFVVDSQKIAFERNIISWNELDSYLGTNLIELPKIIAFNKQDLPNKFCSAIFLKKIDYIKYKNINTKFTIALNGEGILESFETILRLIFNSSFGNALIPTFN